MQCNVMRKAVVYSCHSMVNLSVCMRTVLAKRCVLQPFAVSCYVYSINNVKAKRLFEISRSVLLKEMLRCQGSRLRRQNHKYLKPWSTGTRSLRLLCWGYFSVMDALCPLCSQVISGSDEKKNIIFVFKAAWSCYYWRFLSANLNRPGFSFC